MHIAVGNFLSNPKYDAIVANFKALTQVQDKPKSTEKKPANGSLEGIDFSKVKEVDFIRHDQHIGSATMATNLFENAMKKAGKKTPVKAIRINELLLQLLRRIWRFVIAIFKLWLLMIFLKIRNLKKLSIS